MGGCSSSNKQAYQCSSPGTPPAGGNTLLGSKRVSIVNGSTEPAKQNNASRRLTVNGVATTVGANVAAADFTDEEVLLEGMDVMKLLKDTVKSGKCAMFQSKLDPNLKESFKNKMSNKTGTLDSKTLGWACKKGLKPKSQNQDSWMILQGGDDFSLYIVCDGHGQDGHTISDLVINTIPKMIMHDPEFKSNLRDVMEKTFEKMHKYVVKSGKAHGFDADLSGCTATVIHHDRLAGKLLVCHVGDSGACVATKDGPLKAKVLIEDHKPEQPEERARIEARGGRVEWDGYANHRVYGANTDTPGMNMSRALGDDLGHRIAGVTYEPTIKEVTLTAEDKFLCVCSDGVWEFLKPDMVVSIMNSGKSPQDACEKVTKKSWDCWIKEERGEVVDDITALFVKLPQLKNISI